MRETTPGASGCASRWADARSRNVGAQLSSSSWRTRYDAPAVVAARTPAFAAAARPTVAGRSSTVTRSASGAGRAATTAATGAASPPSLTKTAGQSAYVCDVTLRSPRARKNGRSLVLITMPTVATGTDPRGPTAPYDVRMARRVLLHIGTPKTATTYLQDILFRNQDVLAKHE